MKDPYFLAWNTKHDRGQVRAEMVHATTSSNKQTPRPNPRCLLLINDIRVRLCIERSIASRRVGEQQTSWTSNAGSQRPTHPWTLTWDAFRSVWRREVSNDLRQDGLRYARLNSLRQHHSTSCPNMTAIVNTDKNDRSQFNQFDWD
jgi:hypothetical protein